MKSIFHSKNILFFYEYEKNHTIEELYILHGDTLFRTVEQKTDLLYFGQTNLFYKWGYLKDIIGTDNIEIGPGNPPLANPNTITPKEANR